MLKLGYDLLQEAALYVLNTSSIEAALSIFTEGEEPVVGVARRNGDAINGMEMSKEKQYLEDEDEDEDEDLQLPGIRETASAPF
ncbi:hypothetical protein NC653_019384 [Populus alba x Populus x berolinensis]|uniref:Uncharacterized protein n=1 Tax=Populus alba x Populus x berolinensis TaxID=444605 RepID=A0AAD6QJ09_9ROSI|nr:hypothetical protein NC653_019384 [Populus alba x Populus x berolinensis]